MVTLAEEVPFVAAVHKDHLQRICSACFEPSDGQALSRCARCKTVHYCSKDCQKNDWEDHKHECRLVREYPESFMDHNCRLLARLAFKLKKPEAQTTTFNGRNYEDLDDHFDAIDRTIPEIEAQATIEYIGQKYIPNREALVSMHGKLAVHAFSITEDQFIIGSALYIGLSAHKHSCNPDAYIIYNGKKALLRSQNKDQEYSKDLTVTYVDLLKTTSDRQEMLRSVFYTTCNCSLCQDPSKDFLKNSIRSTCCPDSYCPLDPNAAVQTCFKCGKPSKITVHEAVELNNEIRNMNPAIFNEDTYSDYVKVLSPLNVNLMQIVYTLFGTHLVMGQLLECRKYTDFLQKIYREYLVVGNPFLTSMLRNVATIMTITDRPSRECLDLFEETLDITIKNHGPGHFHTEACISFLNEYKERCRKAGII